MEAPSIISEPPKQKKKNTATSWIHNHGTEFISSTGEKRWRCDICPRNSGKSWVASATSNQAIHLKKIHGLTDPSLTPTNNGGPRQTTFESHIKKPISLEVLCALIVEWIVERRHAFTEVESPKLREIFEYLDPRSTKALHTGNTI